MVIAKKREGQKKKAAVIGYPLSHSLSPMMHQYWLEHHGIHGDYALMEIKPEDFARTVPLLFQQGLVGFNVTLPYKQEIIRFCDMLSDEARAVNAVNCVYKNDDGKIIGDNTDIAGYYLDVKSRILDAKPDYIFGTKKLLLLGAGGAAYAVLFALMKMGFSKFIIANRTLENAERLKSQALKMHALLKDNMPEIDIALTQNNLEQMGGMLHEVDMVVNTTQLGMTGQPDLPLPEESFMADMIVSDIIYRPQETALLKKARQDGCLAIGGLGMLTGQARPSFEKFFGIFPECDDVLNARFKEVLA